MVSLLSPFNLFLSFLSYSLPTTSLLSTWYLLPFPTLQSRNIPPPLHHLLQPWNLSNSVFLQPTFHNHNNLSISSPWFFSPDYQPCSHEIPSCTWPRRPTHVKKFSQSTRHSHKLIMAPVKQPSTFEQIKNSPAFTVAVQVSLFAAGVAFIQSPLMDFLVPQL